MEDQLVDVSRKARIASRVFTTFWFINVALDKAASHEKWLYLVILDARHHPSTVHMIQLCHAAYRLRPVERQTP